VVHAETSTKKKILVSPEARPLSPEARPPEREYGFELVYFETFKPHSKNYLNFIFRKS